MNDDIVFKLPKSRVDELVAEKRGKQFDPRREAHEFVSGGGRTRRT